MSTTIDEVIVNFGVIPADADAQHHGIKGQKWGVRKEDSSGGKATLTDPRHLSDSDLRSAVARMQLERQFSQLQKERVQEGGDFAKSMLKEIGKTQVRRVASKAADIAVEQALKSVGKKAGIPGLGEVAKRMQPKKK